MPTFHSLHLQMAGVDMKKLYFYQQKIGENIENKFNNQITQYLEFKGQ